MYVDAKRIQLRLYDPFSLKDKRSVIKSIIHKVQNKFNISISEVADHDILNKATLGIAIVSNSHQHNDQSISALIDFIERTYEVELIVIDDYFDL